MGTFTTPPQAGPRLGGTFAGRVVINPVALQRLLKGDDGPVVRDMMKAGQLVKAEAQRLVGVYDPPDAYSAAHRARRPGTLRDSIVTRLVKGGRFGVTVLVGSEDPIALIHHEGTRPHTITARRRPFLVFYWPKIGAVVRTRSVNHPGTQPNRYLVNALRVLRGRY